MFSSVEIVRSDDDVFLAIIVSLLQDISSLPGINRDIVTPIREFSNTFITTVIGIDGREVVMARIKKGRTRTKWSLNRFVVVAHFHINCSQKEYF